jgi:hypothetical protein
VSGPELSVAFFLQIVVILGVSRVVGSLARRLGHPHVVGEMWVCGRHSRAAGKVGALGTVE